MVDALSTIRLPEHYIAKCVTLNLFPCNQLLLLRQCTRVKCNRPDQISGADIRFKEDQDRFVRAGLFKITCKTLTVSFLNDIL